ncbi:high affinity methionine permease [Penicillium maclennaniae]|uniref:high affinity methionine permease n=1 Tax=Penicillium maclennaniae TaxID=1343394 RepID=UPI002540860A|nr:high affinity methionine permease [Penicillium maclennaniae]KAJ5677409.1 high affinity methionine permease [Penicillium maclennaniae]
MYSWLTLCDVYYYPWIDFIPKYKGFEYRQTIVKFDDGTVTHQFVQVPKSDLSERVAQHDASGRLIREEVY